MAKKAKRWAKKWTGLETIQKLMAPKIEAPKPDTAAADALRAQAVQAATANADLSIDNIAQLDLGGDMSTGTAARKRKRTGSVASSLGINV